MTSNQEALKDMMNGASSGSGQAEPYAVAAANQDAPPSRFAPRRWDDRVRTPLIVGHTYEAWHPFKREKFTSFDEGGGYTSETWVPGWRYEPCGPEDCEEVWDGEGLQLRTVISLHKPGRYPERVFYVRQWRAPDGRLFGKTNLRSVVTPTFRHWLHGERWPTYSRARDAHVIWARAAGTTHERLAAGTHPRRSGHQCPNQIQTQDVEKPSHG